MRSYKTKTGNPNESAARTDFEEKKAEKKEKQARENKGFVQVYPRGFRRFRELAGDPKTVSAARLYAVLAENINKEGAVIATQKLLAKILGVSIKTVQRHSEILEAEKAIHRFQIQGGVYVYALNPEEVWAGYNAGKEHAPFYTGTIYSGVGGNTRYVRKSLNVMLDIAELAEQARAKKAAA